MGRTGFNLKIPKFPVAVLSFVITGCGGGGTSQPSGIETLSDTANPPSPLSCTHTLTWENPTENVDGWPLDSDELTAATIYVFVIPMAEPEEAELQIGENPYVLVHTRTVQAGTYYYRLTVSNEAGESDHSNEVEKSCG